jgi:hypothetical protein
MRINGIIQEIEGKEHLWLLGSFGWGAWIIWERATGNIGRHAGMLHHLQQSFFRMKMAFRIFRKKLPIDCNVVMLQR